jgi:hypothetical protein
MSDSMKSGRFTSPSIEAKEQQLEGIMEADTPCGSDSEQVQQALALDAPGARKGRQR